MCIGPLKRLCHWGPLTAIFIIKIVSFTTIHCNGKWWPPQESFSGVINSTVFILLSGSTIYNFLNSLFGGPGYVPLGWRPPDLTHCQFLQWCQVCKGYKAPRSHHCKKCGRCVLKMDHHCPWINGCVGHSNHTSFTFFLIFAVCGCSQAAVVIACSLYYALYRNWYLYHGTGMEPVVQLNVYMFALTVFGLGLAIGVVIAVGMLLVCQMRSICRNKTCIEEWIVSKAVHRRMVAELEGEKLDPFVFPYDLGWISNLQQVINISLNPVGDGISWRVAKDCDQYTLTMEQIAQKSQKKKRSVPFIAVKAYSGAILPLAHGWRVFCSPPCSEESRLPLSVGDQVITSRYFKHWLFGEKCPTASVGGSSSSVRLKGWYPRCCVTRVDIPAEEPEAEEDDKKND